MPRRSGGRPAAPAARRPTVPATVPQSHPPAPLAPQQPRQPGLFGQMAATAGGVAIGSAVGHTIGHALTGGGAAASQAAAAEQAPSYQQQQQQYANPCAQHLEAFLQCAKQNAGDLNVCYGFNEALKECKLSYGLQ